MIKNHPGRTIAAALAIALGSGSAGCRNPDLTAGRYQGMIEYDQRDLAFEVPGRLVELRVVRGQEIAAGQVIAREDDVLDREQREVRAREVEVAEADLALVKVGARKEDLRTTEAQIVAARATEDVTARELAREQALVARGALPGAGLDAIGARLAQAKSQRQSLEERLRLLRSGARAEEIGRAVARVAGASQALALQDHVIDKRTLTAPVTGVVLDVYVEPGEMAAAGTPVVAVIDPAHPYADVFVPVPEVPALRVGDRAWLRVEGVAEEVPGAVEIVFPHAEFTPRFVFSPRERPNLMLRVRVRLEDRSRRLHGGLPAYVRFEAPAPAGVAAPPVDAGGGDATALDAPVAGDAGGAR